MFIYLTLFPSYILSENYMRSLCLSVRSSLYVFTIVSLSLLYPSFYCVFPFISPPLCVSVHKQKLEWKHLDVLVYTWISILLPQMKYKKTDFFNLTSGTTPTPMSLSNFSHITKLSISKQTDT